MSNTNGACTSIYSCLVFIGAPFEVITRIPEVITGVPEVITEVPEVITKGPKVTTADLMVMSVATELIISPRPI